MAQCALAVKPDVLTFTGNFTKETSARLNLENTSSKLVYFKISCNLAKGPVVTPSRGVIKPHEACDVNVVLGAFEENPVDKNIKFVVHYLQKEDNSVIDTVENVFKCFQGKKPFHLLKCNFFNPNPFNEIIGENRNLNVADLQKQVEELRKENTELKLKISGLTASASPQKNREYFH